MKKRKPAKTTAKRRSNTKFKWYDEKDTSFLAVKNKHDNYDSEYHVEIYKVDGENDYTWEVIGPLGPVDSGECKTIQKCKLQSLKSLSIRFNMSNMVNV